MQDDKMELKRHVLFMLAALYSFIKQFVWVDHVTLWYLWVHQPRVIGFQVINDPIHSTGERNATNQQHQQHHVRERGCDIHNLHNTTQLWNTPWNKM